MISSAIISGTSALTLASSESDADAAIENATDLVASVLPALSLERYSTTCEPAAETGSVVTNGLAELVLSLRTHSPVAPSVLTRYSV